MILIKPSKKLQLFMYRIKKKNRRLGFRWCECCDPDIYKNGVILCWMYGSSHKCQMLVETLSAKTGKKVDFSVACGRIIVKTYPENISACHKILENDKIMKLFIQPYEEPVDYSTETESERRARNIRNKQHLSFLHY